MNDKQKHFLTLRADGLSFDKIAATLKTNKQTLIKWSKLFASEINDLKFQSLADLKEQYKHTQRAKYEQLLKHLQKNRQGDRSSHARKCKYQRFDFSTQ
ncbi:MAG TPA: hypothetical protein PLV58_09975 [Campylobacterales bacterium]|nr:hypothetical protein [Campylobacterales bacterium]